MKCSLSFVLLAVACLYMLQTVGALPGRREKCTCKPNTDGGHNDHDVSDDKNGRYYNKKDRSYDKYNNGARSDRANTRPPRRHHDDDEHPNQKTTEDHHAPTTTTQKPHEPSGAVCKINKVLPEFVSCYANKVAKKKWYDNPETHVAFNRSLTNYDANSMANFISEINHKPANREVLVAVMNCYLEVAINIK
ncbi:hypothetical protein WDU94_010072 [Cyamophila willieti]